MSNHIYTTVDEIITDIARLFPKKIAQRESIVAWLFQMETDLIPDVDNMGHYVDMELEVVQGTTRPTAALPPNLYKIVEVYSSSNSTVPIEYSSNGAYLTLRQNYTKDSVLISYYGVLVAENGDPLILKHHREAGVWHCIHNMLLEDYIDEKIGSDRWAFILQTKNIKMGAASSSLRTWTADDFRRMQIIMGNLVPRIGSMTLTHKRFG